jgi:uncharacterized membrane protein required for colicin V production
VLLVFFVLGLFKGLVWQVSRIAILATAYVVAGRFGGDLAVVLAGPAEGPAVAAAPAVAPPPGAEGAAAVPAAVPAAAPGETTIYLAYVLLFVAVLVVLSLLAMLVQKLVAKAGLTFFDRLGGGVLGIATGACVVVFGLSLVNMFFRQSHLAMAAERSQSQRLSKRAIDWFGDRVPDELREVFALAPLHPPLQAVHEHALPTGPVPHDDPMASPAPLPRDASAPRK